MAKVLKWLRVKRLATKRKILSSPTSQAKGLPTRGPRSTKATFVKITYPDALPQKIAWKGKMLEIESSRSPVGDTNAIDINSIIESLTVMKNEIPMTKIPTTIMSMGTVSPHQHKR